jgi:hypothetical protein
MLPISVLMINPPPYGISPSDIALADVMQGCDFLRKSQLESRGFGIHPKEKCSSGKKQLRREGGAPG